MKLIDNRYVSDIQFTNFFETRLAFTLDPYVAFNSDLAAFDDNANGIPDGVETPSPSVSLRNNDGFAIQSIDDVGDYNGDGISDLVFERQFTYLPPVVLLGSSSGQMREATILGDAARETIGEAFHADFNGDGLTDIYGTVNGYAYRWPNTPTDQRGSFASGGDLLLLNQGNDTFMAQPVPSMLKFQSGNDLHYNHGGHFGDYDNDGDMDVLSIEDNGLVGSDDGVITVKRINFNNGDATFTYSSDRIPTSTAQPDADRDTQFGGNPSARFADLNNDGIVDLTINTRVVGEDDVLRNGGIHIYLNDGNGIVSDDQVIKTRTHWAIENKVYLESRYLDLDFQSAGFHSAFTNFFDVNDDGFLDILVGQKVSFSGYDGTAGGFQLFINESGESFREATEEFFPNLDINYRLGSPSADNNSISDITRFNHVDINGDGYKDFVMEQGETSISPILEDQIFPYVMINVGGKYYPVAYSDVVGTFASERDQGMGNLVAGDFDGDGLTDFASIAGLDSNGEIEQGKDRAISTGVFVHLAKSFSGRIETGETIMRGTGRDDSIIGDSSNNWIIPGIGNDFVNGLSGVDRVQFWDNREDFLFNLSDDGLLVSSGDGQHQLRNVERLIFDDTKFAIDITGSAGLTAKTLAAVIGEAGLSNKEYVGIGLQLFDAGQSLATVCKLALTAVGATTNEDVVNTLYSNLYGESPSDDQLQEYVELLDQGVFTKGSLAAAAAELTDDLGVIDLVGLAEKGIEYV